MNNLFTPALRSDTMGLDYHHPNLKDYVYKDTWPCDNYYWTGCGEEGELLDAKEEALLLKKVAEQGWSMDDTSKASRD